MKFSLLFVTIIITFVNCQFPTTNLYANFIPFGANSDCSGEITGVGFSLLANGNCYHDIAHNENGYHESSWMLIVDALRVGVAEYHNYNNESCGTDFINAQSLKNGSCILTPGFMVYNGTLNSYYLSNQYSVITISKSPFFIPNTQVYLQYNNGAQNGCISNSNSEDTSTSSSSSSNEILYMMYTTSGSKFISNSTESNGDSFTIECSSNGDASIYVCKGDDQSSCDTQNITMPCTSSETEFNEIYCTLPSGSNKINKL